NLVGLFDRVVANALEILLQIPRATAVRIAQASHDLDQAGDVARGLHGNAHPFVGFGPTVYHRKPGFRKPQGGSRKCQQGSARTHHWPEHTSAVRIIYIMELPGDAKRPTERCT